MQVASAQVSASAYHQLFMQSAKHESMRFATGGHQPRIELPVAPVSDKLSLSSKALADQSGSQEVTASDQKQEELSPRDRLIYDIVSSMIKAMTGQEPQQFFSAKELAGKMQQVQQTANTANSQVQQAYQSVAATGAGLAYDSYQSYYEAETLSYSAEATIKTKDGQELQFSVQLDITRELFIERKDSLRLGDAVNKVDPLVVNFDGNAAELSDTKFHFDLDVDGRLEQIALLKQGSGLLALDKNGDGKINNGSELFGPKTGNGFIELADYDKDKNNFIDEGDSIFNRLRIWTQNERGDQSLVGLGAKGIGAIYLGQTATPFAYKDATNAPLGAMTATGLFFRDNGSAGTIQHIDYAI